MVYQVLNEGKVDLSWRNTELEMLLGYHNRDANSSQKYHPRCFLVVLVVKKLTCQCKNAILGFRRKLEAGDVDSVIGLYVVYVLGEHRIIREDNCAGHSTRGSRLTPIKRSERWRSESIGPTELRKSKG